MFMMPRTLRVLLLAESGTEIEVIRSLKQVNQEVKVRRVDSSGSFIESLREFKPEVVLVDDSSAQLEAGSAIGIVQEEMPTAPIVVMMTELDEARATSFLRAGAEAFIMKANSAKLSGVIEAALFARKQLSNLT